MPANLCLTVRFLQPYSHGRRGDGEPEWPPSPLRLFQALVAAAAARWNERTRLEYAAPALRWLEGQNPPTIVSAPGVRSEVKYRLYVPDNVGDLVAKSWTRGGDDSIANYRTEKDVRPTHLNGDTVYYLFPLAGESCPHFGVLAAAARSITHLGWGVDIVAGNASVLTEEEAARLPGERWQPANGGVTALRVPKPGTLEALCEKHAAFLNRVGPDGFKPVPPLTAFDIVGYRRDTDPPRREFAVFQLLTPDGERRWNRDPRRAVEVAGMLRHATRDAARTVGWDDARVATFVCGHGTGTKGQAVGDAGARRFSYVPLPTIRPQGVVGQVNRVLVVGPPDAGGADAAWARRLLSGRELIDERTKSPVALLSPVATSEWVVRQYTGSPDGSAAWSTVIPVVLPGYDDHGHLRRRLGGDSTADAKKRLLARLDARIERLIRTAIVQAGFSPTLARHADLSWRLVGFRPGVDLATRYDWPAHLRGKPRYHVRIRWQDTAGNPVRVLGPMVLGAGRFCGLGLFAADG